MYLLCNPIFLTLSLRGKVAYITGLGQTQSEGWGIGAAIAVLSTQRGY
ncbi:hypothetical protein PITC_021560 [Penicillium italicum]|uniref:Uncharacterized protein n=1 Tax=Penicillium italicum TaxID=40296 RepID=A0A0A2L304_PENIT|nr:hypothetical protein PITC_021560 [Penicillium italicum]